MIVNHTSRQDVTIVMADLNASIASDRIAHRGIISPVCSRFTNDNGSRLLYACNDFRIGSSWFPRKPIHQLTWYSNDGVTRKVLDHVIISRRWFSCMTSCRVFRSAELGPSDHRLLAFSLRLRTKACKQTTPTKRYNTDALNNHYSPSPYVCAPRHANRPLQPSTLTQTPLTTTTRLIPSFAHQGLQTDHSNQAL